MNNTTKKPYSKTALWISVTVVVVAAVVIAIVVGVIYGIKKKVISSSSSTSSIEPASFKNVKLVGVTGTGTAEFQGISSAISGDGLTSVFGCPGYNAGIGAAFVYANLNGSWSLQGILIGTGYTGSPSQGVSVSLSNDGNTLAVGGSADTSNNGAVWVFSRSGQSWTQQAFLNHTGTTMLGNSVSLSSDGNSLVAGAPNSSSSVGESIVWTRSGTTWTYVTTLIGSGEIGASAQGTSVSISGNANYIAIGGPKDNTNVGAFWIFELISGTWTQISTKFVLSSTGSFGTSIAMDYLGDYVAIAEGLTSSRVAIFNRSGSTWTQGALIIPNDFVNTGTTPRVSVAFTPDASVLMLGNSSDNNNTGAFWLFGRSGSTWNQMYPKLVSTSAIGAAQQGFSVSICSNGRTMIEGGPYDNTYTGAAWIFSY